MRAADAFAHRALVAAIMHGVASKGADLVVATEETFGANAKTLGRDGVLAVVASSPTVSALIASAAGSAAGSAAASAWSHAIAWSSVRARASVASPLPMSRLRALTAAADAAGLSLVVPDVALASPPLAHIAQTRFPRTPLARAALHLYARGAVAFPLLFVPHARAPKNGLPKTKLDRIADGWVAASSAVTAPTSSSLAPLVASAVELLAKSETPLSFKELLRAAREHRGAVATGDAKQLVTALYRLWSDHAVDLFAIDPQGHLPFSS